MLLLGAEKEPGSAFVSYLIAQLVTTFFCLYWDYKWDWGLFRGKTAGRRLLRDEMKFSPAFVYTCVFTNLVFRFWWLFAALTLKLRNDSNFIAHFEFFTFLGMMIEAVRRTQWSILRVENEFFNNFEQYRDIIIIPPIKN